MKIEITDLGHRYPVGDDDSAKFEKQNQSEIETLEASRRDHLAWYEGAKDQQHIDINDPIVLADARRHLEAARTWPAPVKDGTSMFDSRWSPWAEAFYQQSKDLKTPTEVLRFAQARIPFDHRERLQPGSEGGFFVYEKMLEQEFPFYAKDRFRLADNPRSIPETMYLYNGRLVSNVFFWHFRTVLRCKQDVNPSTIMEIGGGYGAIARLWLHMGIKRYFIFDLPESLFFAEVCLRTEFPGEVGYWQDDGDPGTRVVLVPVSRANECGLQFDLVTSVGSLQEMSDSWVDFYMDWLDRHRPRFFYSLNYMGSPINIMYESRNLWSPKPNAASWMTISVNADVPLVRAQCTGRDFAEVIYACHKPVRKFAEWSVLRGCLFNRATYLDGLELLRQDFTISNAIAFLQQATTNHDSHRLLFPKECAFIAAVVYKETKDERVKKLVDYLMELKKEGIH